MDWMFFSKIVSGSITFIECIDHIAANTNFDNSSPTGTGCKFGPILLGLDATR